MSKQRLRADNRVFNGIVSLNFYVTLYTLAYVNFERDEVALRSFFRASEPRSTVGKVVNFALRRHLPVKYLVAIQIGAGKQSYFDFTDIETWCLVFHDIWNAISNHL